MTNYVSSMLRPSLCVTVRPCDKSRVPIASSETHTRAGSRCHSVNWDWSRSNPNTPLLALYVVTQLESSLPSGNASIDIQGRL